MRQTGGPDAKPNMTDAEACGFCVCMWCTLIQDLNSRAQAEVTIREALRELDLWGAAATFTLTEYTDSSGRTLTLIKDWKDIVNQVDVEHT